MGDFSVTKSNSITFVIFTYNEERRIKWAIENFIEWGRVLIVDNYSADKTVDVARSYGCDVLMNKNKGWVEDSETVEKVWAAVRTPWIYWGFADEMADNATLTAISDAVDSNQYCIVNVIRKNFYYGKFCHDAYSARMNRIFKKDAIDFSSNVIHGFGRTTVPKDKIYMLDSKRYYIRHFISNDAKSYLRSMDGYTDIEAARTKRNYSLFAILSRTLKSFIAEYFIHGACRAGSAGLFLVLQTIYYGWLLTMKSYENEKGLRAPQIEFLNDTERRYLAEKQP
jgi:glycosyltransferase involved in cell wall biosynthesis